MLRDMIITPARMAERLARGFPNKGAPAPEEPAEDAPDLPFMTPLHGTIDRSICRGPRHDFDSDSIVHIGRPLIGPFRNRSAARKNT